MTKTFVVLFEENSDAKGDIRENHFQAHLKFLEENADAIRDAGRLFHNDVDRCGGMWVVTAQTESDVVQLVHNDPFWPTGLRLSFKVLEWRKVVEKGIAI